MSIVDHENEKILQEFMNVLDNEYDEEQVIDFSSYNARQSTNSQSKQPHQTHHPQSQTPQTHQTHEPHPIRIPNEFNNPPVPPARE
jgi:hypothetical protein